MHMDDLYPDSMGSTMQIRVLPGIKLSGANLRKLRNLDINISINLAFQAIREKSQKIHWIKRRSRTLEFEK